MWKSIQIIGAAAVLFVFSGLAQGTIIPVLDSTPSPNGMGGFVFNYRADLTGDGRLDPIATNGATCPGLNQTEVACAPSGTFFTIYDIAGFQSASTTASSWGYTIQLTGITPSSINGGGFDDASTINVMFFYTGPVVAANGSLISFAPFMINSTYGGMNSGGVFTSQATSNVGGTSGLTVQTTGPLTVPGSDVPEPASIALIGAGLVVIAVVRRGTRSHR